MAVVAIRLPDVGEGVAEAELVEWHVAAGDVVREDEVLAAVMTDKATVEIPSPASGTVTWLAAAVGDTVAVGAELIRIDTGKAGGTGADVPAAADLAAGPTENEPVQSGAAGEQLQPAMPVAATSDEPAMRIGRQAQKPRHPGPPHPGPPHPGPPRPEGQKPLAAPAVRLRAREAGVDLRRVAGTGPAGRITHDDLDAFFAGEAAPAAGRGRHAPDDTVTEVKVVGLRRRIAERMALANARIAHITIVEEVDVTEVERLRAMLNGEGGKQRPKLTLLPFILRAIVRAVGEQPEINAHYDDEAGTVRQFGAVHAGIATQTPGGLIVPVLRHAETLGLWQSAAEIARLAEAARAGSASREELSGSTITITSLGPLGAIATTPIINHPEVAIVGVNRIAVRPVWQDGQFVPRKMMNLSSSFDHRVIDGWNAAVFVQRMKTLLEAPAMLFVED